MTPHNLNPSWLDRSLFPFTSRSVDIDGNVVHYVDEGTGPVFLMLHSNLRRIFEPFRCGKESTGLGLGLYIVQQIARGHGGSVSARSESGRTTFSVALPR